MSDYLIIESRDPYESAGVRDSFELACDLARQGNGVTLFMVQNGVMPARRGARGDHLEIAADAGVVLLADDFSLRERGIGTDELTADVSPSPLETVVDRLAAGAKTFWH